MVICNHAKYSLQKHKDQDDVFMILGSNKSVFPSLKTSGYEFKTPLLRFVPKKVKKCAFSC
jgi:hypothetical protein